MTTCAGPRDPVRAPGDDLSARRSAPPGGRLAAAATALVLLVAGGAAPLAAKEGRSAQETVRRSFGASPLSPSPPETAPDTTEAPLRASLARRPWQAWLRDGFALASLFALDRPLRYAARQVESGATEASAVDRIADRAEWFGDWKGSLPWIVGGSLGVGALTEGTQGLEEGSALLAGTAAAAMVNEAVNRAVGRGRPSWEEGVLNLDPFRGHASFPSGHTAYVFGVASGVDVVTDGWAPAAAAYGVAGLTGLSRIYHDRHWLTDVVAGAALATVVSRVATQRALRLLGAEDGWEEGAARAERRTAGAPARVSAETARTGAPGSLSVEPLVTARALGVTLRF